MKDEIKFKEWLSLLAEIYNHQVTSIMASAYWKILEPFTDEQCEGAFNRIIQTAKFFPKPAEIIEAIAGKSQDLATIAWIKLIETVRRVGPYQSVMFDDPIIHEVIEFMGGWPATGEWLEGELKWKQKEFERMYSVLAASSRKDVKYLAGIHEINNTSGGYEPLHQVIKIGFDDRDLRRITHGSN